MEKRAVYLEKSWVGAAGVAGIYHYAVKVEDEWYELEPAEGGKKDRRRNYINGSPGGYPRSDGAREERIAPVLTCAGATRKTDDVIQAFNRDWVNRNPRYESVGDNCQKYALDLIQLLVGASFKMDIPSSSVNAWADRPGCHAVSRDGHHQARATTGKAGAQYGWYAAEAEGPSAGAEVTEGYIGAEASLGRAEGQVGPAGVRLEPNLNTGVGVAGGQVKAKALGLGVTAGLNGLGFHTPLGSIGLGKF